MRGQRNRRGRGAGIFLALILLLVSSFADRVGDHEPGSTLKSARQLNGAEPSHALAKTDPDQRNFAKTNSATEQSDAEPREKDPATAHPKLIGLEHPVSDFAQLDFTEVKPRTWHGGYDQSTWTGGSIESLPPSSDGVRFDFTSSLSGGFEVVLPFGEEAAKDTIENEFDNDFRVFGSLTMKF